MGRGSYIGGHTILYRGRFASFDPAENRRSWSKTARRRTKHDAAELAEIHRKDFLYLVIKSHIQKTAAPKFFKKMPEMLKKEIQRHSSSYEWAKTQPNFRKIYCRISATVGGHPATSDAPEHTIAVLKREIEAQKTIIKAAKKAIKEYQKRIDRIHRTNLKTTADIVTFR